MATITSTLKLQDKMSSTFSSLTKAMHSTLNVMKSVSSENGNMSKSFDSAKKDIINAEKELKSLQQELRNTNQESKNTGNAFDVFMGNMLTKAFDKAIQGAQSLVRLSDQYVSTTARLNMMNDGLQTTVELQDEIYKAAQRSRAGYQSMADIVSKLGNQAGEAFGNNSKQVIAFSELLNKLFTSQGLDTSSIDSVMYNLTQSLSSGKLLGNDYRILKQNAPQMIAYLREFYGVSQAQLDEMVSKGQVTAQGLKKAMFKASDDINNKFNQMPITWGQLWTKITNEVQKMLQPLLKAISAGVQFISDHWGTIKMVLTALAITIGIVTVAWIAYQAQVKLAILWQNILNGTISAAAIKMAILAVVIFIIVLALIYLWNTNDDVAYYMLYAWDALRLGAMLLQLGVQAAFYAIILAGLYMYEGILGIKLGLQTAFYMIILAAQTMKLGFETVVQGIVNAFIWMYNTIVGLLNKLGAKFETMDYANFTSKTVDSISKTMTDYANAAAETYGEMGDVTDKITDYQAKLNDITYNGATNIQNKASEFNATREARTKNRKTFGTNTMGADLGNSLGDAIDDALEGVIGNDGSGGKALKTTSNDKLLSDDDIQLLLDIATRDYKLNYQSVTPNITLTFGDVRETANVDDILDEVADRLEEIYDANLEVG